MHHRTGRIAKTHRGLRTQFTRLTQAEPRIDPAFVRFLVDAYEIKSVADYGAEPQATVSMADAHETIETAGGMIDCITILLEPDN